MKKFVIYKNIRKRAVIMGLPIALFALMMTVVIGSLLVIIFSFNLLVVVLVFVINGVLYMILTQITQNPAMFHFKKVFPQTISNKKISEFHYDQD